MTAAAGNTRTIHIEGVDVELVRKRVKNLNLSVRGHSGHVRVSAPLRASDAEVRRFVASKLGWIQRHQARLRGRVPPAAPEYISGERHRLFGESLVLQQVLTQGRQQVEQHDGILRLHVRPRDDREQRQALVQAWYRQQLAARIPALIAHYEPVMDVRVAEWRIRRMRTRWGTCNIRARRIWLNLALAQYPPACLEYIVVHEMTHLLERLHNARFHALMDRFLPDWRRASEALANR